MTSKNKKKIGILAIILLALSCLIAGFYTYQFWIYKPKINRTNFHGTYLEHPRPINKFSLDGIDKKTFNNASMHNRWTIVFFGFTSCGYLCPTTMAELGKMYRILEHKKIVNLPQIVMISIDPERDDQVKLAHYVHSFHPQFYGALGDEKTIMAMTREMGVAYTKVYDKKNSDSQNYDVQHSGALMLFNPYGELNAFFTTPHHADLLARDYMLLIS